VPIHLRAGSENNSCVGIALDLSLFNPALNRLDKAVENTHGLPCPSCAAKSRRRDCLKPVASIISLLLLSPAHHDSFSDGLPVPLRRCITPAGDSSH
jgi:hypothetical protein